MKKLLTIAIVLAAVMAYADYRVIDMKPQTDNVLTITITDYSRLSSIGCTVSASGETNSFTITASSVLADGSATNTYTYATAIADVIEGTATDGAITVYNANEGADTLVTSWLKPGDKLLLTGNDATPTDYTNVFYKVVLETAE